MIFGWSSGSGAIRCAIAPYELLRPYEIAQQKTRAVAGGPISGLPEIGIKNAQAG
jgi:hypothetical protein